MGVSELCADCGVGGCEMVVDFMELMRAEYLELVKELTCQHFGMTLVKGLVKEEPGGPA